MGGRGGDRGEGRVREGGEKERWEEKGRVKG